MAAAVLPDGKIDTVESLVVRELRGVGATFTPNLNIMLVFLGLTYKPQGEFEAVHQIITGELCNDARVTGRAHRVAYVPCFSWATFEMVIAPFKLTSFGRRTLEDLKKLQPRFPNFKAFVEWVEGKRRHVVRYEVLNQQEAEAIARVTWPTREQILDVLESSAYDNVATLADANDDIRRLLRFREVD